MSSNRTQCELLLLYIMSSRNTKQMCSMHAVAYQKHKIIYSFDIYAAVEIIKRKCHTKNSIDIVFIEYYLDVMEAILLVEELRKIDPAILPVIFVKTKIDLAKIRNQYPGYQSPVHKPYAEGIDYKVILGMAIEKKLAQLIKGSTQEQNLYVLCPFQKNKKTTRKWNSKSSFSFIQISNNN